MKLLLMSQSVKDLMEYRNKYATSEETRKLEGCLTVHLPHEIM